ncbi:MAG: glycosyltransferase family 2 protein [Acidobacteriota bacterium]|nr:glycosyltransferase family 2 protein [Acidobacteriota bacterium]
MPVQDDGQVMTVLSIVVPSYNSADYLHHCLDSMLPVPADVEVIVVNDGSTDDTAAIAESYAVRYPGRFVVVNKPNGGHGSGINTGLRQARGQYFKVVDSDDWLAPEPFQVLVSALRRLVADGSRTDLVVTNFVYDKQGKRRKHVMRYGNVFPVGQTVTWDQTRRFRSSQYLLMHALTYRTGVLREFGIDLPEHTFYVDNLFAYGPLALTRTVHYLDVDLYHYYIGRPGQSVNEAVMIKRADQQLKVNRLMIGHLPSRDVPLPGRLRAYLESYLGVVTAVSSIICIRTGKREYLAQKSALWREIRETDRVTWRRLRRTPLGRVVNLHGRIGRRMTLMLYRIARRFFGFN